MRRPHANPSRFEQDEELPADEEGMSQASRLLNQADPQATINAADDAALAALGRVFRAQRVCCFVAGQCRIRKSIYRKVVVGCEACTPGLRVLEIMFGFSL